MTTTSSPPPPPPATATTKITRTEATAASTIERLLNVCREHLLSGKKLLAE